MLTQSVGPSLAAPTPPLWRCCTPSTPATPPCAPPACPGRSASWTTCWAWPAASGEGEGKVGACRGLVEKHACSSLTLSEQDQQPTLNCPSPTLAPQELCGWLRQQPTHPAAPPRRLLSQPPRPLHLRLCLQRAWPQPPGGWVRLLWTLSTWASCCAILCCGGMDGCKVQPALINPLPRTTLHSNRTGGCRRAGGWPQLQRPVRGQALRLPGQVSRGRGAVVTVVGWVGRRQGAGWAWGRMVKSLLPFGCFCFPCRAPPPCLPTSPIPFAARWPWTTMPATLVRWRASSRC